MKSSLPKLSSYGLCTQIDDEASQQDERNVKEGDVLDNRFWSFGDITNEKTKRIAIQSIPDYKLSENQEHAPRLVQIYVVEQLR